jgi:hypothetical protein
LLHSSGFGFLRGGLPEHIERHIEHDRPGPPGSWSSTPGAPRAAPFAGSAGTRVAIGAHRGGKIRLIVAVSSGMRRVELAGREAAGHRQNGPNRETSCRARSADWRSRGRKR